MSGEEALRREAGADTAAASLPSLPEADRAFHLATTAYDTDSRGRRLTCSDHCCGCNQHFSGLKAFDAHRQNGDCQEAELVMVKSRDGTERPALQSWTRRGSCGLSDGCWQDGKQVDWLTPVVIWQKAQTAAETERLRGLSDKTVEKSGERTKHRVLSSEARVPPAATESAQRALAAGSPGGAGRSRKEGLGRTVPTNQLA